jgi:tRNA nucleotidyltransferase/poly(A) polymerase
VIIDDGSLVKVRRARRENTESDSLKRAIALLRQTSLVPDVWLVGGYVRDQMLGRSTNDLDVIVPEGAFRLARALADALRGHFFVLDEERQVGRVILNDGDPTRTVIDVARLRAPQLSEDLRLRDFTVNAMAKGLGSKTSGAHLFDPFDGRSDLERRILRVVTEGAFRDDPLRLLRAIRLSGELGFRIEPRTLSLLKRDAALISSVSAERICDEMYRIITAPGAWQHVRLLAQTDLLRHVLPEAAALEGVEQSPPHYQAVFDHSRSVMAHLEGIYALLWPESDYLRPEPFTGDATVISPDAQWDDVAELLAPYRTTLREHLTLPLASGRVRRDGLMWAALAHDWGKPAMRSEETNGLVRFLDHDNWGALLARNRAQALKMSAAESAYLSRLVQMHMRPAYLAHDYPASWRAIYRYFRDAHGTGLDALLLSLADHMAVSAPHPQPAQWQRRLHTFRLLLDSYCNRHEKRVDPAPLVDGEHLMATFGLRPGPQVGALLEGLREAQAAGEVRDLEDALAWLTQHVVAE